MTKAKADHQTNAMKKFYKHVWLSTKRRQITLILLALVASALAVAPLEIQRHIINMIAGQERADLLVVLCVAFLAASWSLSFARYLLNSRSAALGEAAILALRQDIYAAGRSRKKASLQEDDVPEPDQSGTFVNMLSSEAEAAGKAVGESMSTPVIQLGTLLSVVCYMLWTEPKLGLIVLAIAVPQILIAPPVQRRINSLVRSRVSELRATDNVVVDQLRGNEDSGNSDPIVGFNNIFKLRVKIFKLKFRMKLSVNALQSLGVFIILLAGGLMVLRGQTEIGIVVAFISGLDRTVEPMRELIAFLRSTSVAAVEYDMITENITQIRPSKI